MKINLYRKVFKRFLIINNEEHQTITPNNSLAFPNLDKLVIKHEKIMLQKYYFRYKKVFIPNL